MHHSACFPAPRCVRCLGGARGDDEGECGDEGEASERQVGLARADDSAVSDYARTHGLGIVTKDDDFRQRSFLYGAPPKVILVHLGNCRTADVVALLNARVAVVTAFLSDPTSSLLVVQPVPARTG